MSYLTIHPDFQSLFVEAGLTTAEAVLRLRSIVFSGHPGRNVARTTLTTSDGELRLLIKREHRVRLKERLVSLTDGFGFTSKARREALTLTNLQAAGIPVPQWVAHGEDASGCAFLVLLECVDAVDLRAHLSRLHTPPQRELCARRLGQAVAAIHEAGFDHPDLYSKHVLVQKSEAFCFIDWQRTACDRHVPWQSRIRSLATLNATVEFALASLRERRRFLAAYLIACRRRNTIVPTRRVLDEAIWRETERISRRRRLRELANAQTSEKHPELVWLDGEALCITSEFEKAVDGRMPSWLSLANLPSRSWAFESCETVQWNGNKFAELTRCRRLSWKQVVDRLTGRIRSTSPEVRLAGIIFRLERLGIPVARVLAFGQRYASARAMESFLLQERPQEFVPVREWLRQNAPLPGMRSKRRMLLREAGALLRKLHHANFYFQPGAGRSIDAVFAIRSEGVRRRLAVDRASLLVSKRHESPARTCLDIRQLWKSPAGRQLSRTDRMRFLLGYCGAARCGRRERALWRRVAPAKTMGILAARLLGLLMTW